MSLKQMLSNEQETVDAHMAKYYERQEKEAQAAAAARQAATLEAEAGESLHRADPYRGLVDVKILKNIDLNRKSRSCAMFETHEDKDRGSMTQPNTKKFAPVAAYGELGPAEGASPNYSFTRKI